MSSSKWLIAGLGNPGSQYEKTRHNVGFMAIHHLAAFAGIQGKRESRFDAIVGSGALFGHPVILAEPLTFMNLSGNALSKILHYYKIEPEQLLVIYDDTALPFGKIRIRPSGSAGGHNGMKSIIQMLGGDDKFPRLRIGIGAPHGQRSLHDHVLSKFTPEETQDLEKILTISGQAIERIMSAGVESAMTGFNGLEILPPTPAPPAPPAEVAPE